MTKLAHAKPNKEEGNYGLGTDVFRNRLGNTLVANIKARLPEISAVIDNELKETRKRLEALGKPPPSDEAGRLEYINREIVQPWQYAIRSRLESDLRIRLQATFKGGQPPGGTALAGPLVDRYYTRFPPGCEGKAGTGHYEKKESTMACRATLLKDKLPEIELLAGEVFKVGLDAFKEAASATEAKVGRNASCPAPGPGDVQTARSGGGLWWGW